ncbi:MBL fold metallo-hydrolase [Nocardia rhamnosiphila]
MNGIDDITPGEARLHSTPKLRSVHIGDIRVSYVHDGWVQLAPTSWLPDSSAEYWAQHTRYLDDEGYLRAGMGGVLAETPDGTVLIDAGFGPRRIPADPAVPRLGATTGGSLLASLAALGVSPDQVDVLAFTHLHLDHIGWVSARDPATGHTPFAHARAVTTAAEWNHGTSDVHGPFEETMRMLRARLELVEDASELFPDHADIRSGAFGRPCGLRDRLEGPTRYRFRGSVPLTGADREPALVRATGPGYRAEHSKPPRNSPAPGPGQHAGIRNTFRRRHFRSCCGKRTGKPSLAARRHPGGRRNPVTALRSPQTASVSNSSVTT